jgi:preprotein translocase subunit SecG
MSMIIVALHVVVSVFLIFVILLQPGKGDGMAALGGGGNANSVFGGRGSVTFLAKVTEVCAVIFMITSLTLAYRSSHSDSVLRARRNLAADEAQQQKGTKGAKAPAAPAPAPTNGGTAPTAPAAPSAPPAETPAPGKK